MDNDNGSKNAKEKGGLEMQISQKIWLLANLVNASVFGYLISFYNIGWLLFLSIIAFTFAIWGYFDLEGA
jgi:hypothetical protein